MKVAIYARVSTWGGGQDPTMQTRELREYCGRRGWDVAGAYVDIGISGTKERRPELDRLMADAHRRRFDALVVWKFDRFARSVSHLLRALETFRAQGIEFVSFSEQLDTTTPAGKLRLHCARGCRGAGALTDCRAGEGRAAQRTREREVPRAPAGVRRCRNRRAAARRRSLVGEAGRWGGDRLPRRVRQKPPPDRPRNSHGISGGLRQNGTATNKCFLLGTATTA